MSELTRSERSINMMAMDYASVPQRIGATLADYFINLGVSLVTGLVLGLALGNSSTSASLASLLPLVFTIYNYIYLPGKEGSSLGQKVAKIKIVDAQSGQPVGILRIILRRIIEIFSFLALFLGYFWILWDSKKQGWHDKIANDVVVKL